MPTLRLALASLPVLAGSLRASAAFLGCCDDPPDPPQPPPPQNVTETTLHIDIPEIAKNMQPGEKCVIKTDTTRISADSNLCTDGIELIAHVEVEGGFTTIVIQKLMVAWNKFRGAHGPLAGASTSAGPAAGGTQGSVVPVGGGGASATPLQPLPRTLYRHWISAPITTEIFAPNIVQAIEGDPDQTPIRVSFSVPFGTSQEFFGAGIDNFFVDVRNPGGRSVTPVGAHLVGTDASEWPITSRIIWNPSDPPVISVSFDLVNDDGSMVTPTQLGCDQEARTFTFGMTTTDSKATWDFCWSAGLWRTEVDHMGMCHGQGGMWLGWHASSFEPVAPLNPLPKISGVSDLAGNPLTTVTRGQIIRLTVQGGIADPNGVEMSVGGRVITTLLAIGPGPAPGDSVYTFQVPATSELGLWSCFFRNLGATPLTAPGLVPVIQPGYDHTLLTIQ